MSSSIKWAILALSLVGACIEQVPLGPGADVVVVHAVLNPTTSVLHVDVRHSGRDATGGVPVHGATVTLTAPDGTVRVASEIAVPTDSAQAADSLLRIYCQAPSNYDARYDVAVGALRVGTPYHLRVVLADGTITEGDAIVPAAPPPQMMTERRFDPTTDTLRLAWPRATGARAYEVRIIPQKDSLEGICGKVYFATYDFLAYVDTSVAIVGTTHQHDRAVFQPGLRYDVIVSAVDDHYYDYFAHESDPYTPTALPSSLRGGIGVFGAIVPILRQTIVVEGSTPGP
jgi:hypothetical protein